ncbi:hypothetical protein [Arthrobacter sp. NEB 688]|uniref:hypothetical protein n=1 Tax=Arthrobacter sp. NEB 688 TaxID=904039 RepID=UPI0015636D02|nr:hypothetical protein [Arthrobacter sp. NEB 688]QKE84648.1 hypothetical protein HL663_12340 [Arthrobacter sp. NEB 688]
MDNVVEDACAVMTAAFDGLLVALDTDGDVATAARTAEDGLEFLHIVLEQRYGMGLISDWTDPDDRPFDGPVVRVRLVLDVVDEEHRDGVMSSVDEELCHALDEGRFRILSTTRVFPGARGSAADNVGGEAADVPALSYGGPVPVPAPELSGKLERQRQRLAHALQRLLGALATDGESPRNKNRRRVYERQERFEARVEWLHRRVLRRSGAPLVTSWAYMWDDLPWTGPVVLRTVFDVNDEAREDLLPAIERTLDGLAPASFRLVSAAATAQ